MPIFDATLIDALGRGLDEVLARGLVIDVHEQALADHVVERLEGEIRIDRAAAVADERREVMHLARLAGFEHEADARARAFADEVVMQAGDGEQRAGSAALSLFTPRSERMMMLMPAAIERSACAQSSSIAFFETRRAVLRIEERSGCVTELELALRDVLELGQFLVA